MNIKPLSVNSAWKGKRYKTDEYKNFERSFLLLAPAMRLPVGKLVVEINFGFSSKASDIDNPVKMVLDCLQKKYNFDDKMIYKTIVEKMEVAKGQEFLTFKISSYEPNQSTATDVWWQTQTN